MRESILNISYIAIQLIFGFVPGIFLNYMQESKFKYPIFNVLIMAFLWDAPFIMSYITGTKQPFGIISLLLLIIVSLRKKREDQPPASLGLSFFREER